MQRDALIEKLGNQLVKDIGSRATEWKNIVMVGRFEDGEPEMSGFAYLSNGEAQSFAPENFAILDTLIELRQAMAAEDKNEPWHAAVFRIDRSTGELNGEFEYNDASRWAITFRNSKQRAEELRPKN